MESDRVWARAAIMRAAVNREDAPEAERGWLDWLIDCGIPAITDVDTRALVRHIRDAGAMRGGVFTGEISEAEAREHHRRRAVDDRRGLRARSSRRSRPTRSATAATSGSHAIDTGIKSLDRPQPRRARGGGHAAPVHGDQRRAARHRRRRVLPGQRPGRPRRARLHRRHAPRARRPAPDVGHLPRPPAALPGRRPRDLQAALRPPRRQPPGQGPADRQDRDHRRRTTASRS